MITRMLVLAMVLALLLAGCVAGEGGAGSYITEETTNHNSAEETTALKGGGDLKQPPDSTLSYGEQEVRGRLGSYCTPSKCVDMALLPVSRKQEPLTVPSGSKMVFRYGGGRSPDTVRADAYTLDKNRYQVYSSRRSLTFHGSGVERTILAELPPAEYVVDVFVTELQSDAVYSFRVVVDTPALAGNDIAAAKPIPGHPDFEINDKGYLIEGGDVVVGKCGSSRPFAFQSKSLREEAARACEKADLQTPLTNTGGPPVILVPIALLVVCGLLIRKSTAR